MGDSNAERVAQLLDEGLEQYGVGETAKAILAWEEALVLDPHCVEAADYIKTADRRSVPRPKKDDEPSQAVSNLGDEARQLIRTASYEEALDLLRSAADADHGALDLQAQLDLVRSRLLRKYRRRVGDTRAVPVMKAESGDIKKFNLPSDAGFVLSMIDGSTNVEDLISLSGMDAFEALRVLQGLLETGLIGMER